MVKADMVLELLESADWNYIILKLTHYAFWRAAKYKWKTGNPNQLPGGITPQDVAKNAIEKVWSRTRNWDPEKHPDLLLHLKWIVDSDINHLAESMEHTLSRRISDSIGDDVLDPIPDPTSSLGESLTIKTPEEHLIEQEANEREEKVKKDLDALVKGDEELELLLMCFEEGIDKAEMIASAMGCDVTRVYSLKRKLQRKASAIRKIMKQE